jgi:hypothetical protein
MANDEAAKKKAKLAKLLQEFEGEDLTEILSENLDASTKRALAPKAAAADPAKKEFQEALVETLTADDVTKLKKWADEGRQAHVCRVSGPSPKGMKDGLGGTYDRLTIVFQFSSEKIRDKAREDRKAKETAQE